MHKSKMDLAGQRFSSLVALERAGKDTAQHPMWRCKCDCGTESLVSVYRLLSGHTTSCGCRQRSVRLRHGATTGRVRSPEFRAWVAMKQRCENPNVPHFDTWGGRGIGVCARWADFPTFLADMGPRPSAKHSLDRIDPNGNYEPGNCRWTTKDVQQHNVRPRSNTGHRGVSKPSKGRRYLWRVARRGVVLHGSAKTLDEAIAARDAAQQELYGEAA